jgi:hypothetical protein
MRINGIQNGYKWDINGIYIYMYIYTQMEYKWDINIYKWDINGINGYINEIS